MNQIRSPFSSQSLVRMNLPGIMSHLDQVMGLVDPSATSSSWVPRVDIQEPKESFVIHADVPGVSPDALDIHMDKGELIIQGERTIVSKSEGTMGVRMERASGRFQRRFLLPDSADADNVQATCEHGVLEVIVPKKPKEQPRRIHVGVKASAIENDSESSASGNNNESSTE